MKPARDGLSLQIRPYVPEDEPEVLKLLRTALGGGPAGRRSPEFFRWKHRANPFGPSLMLVGEADGGIVGLRALMTWEFLAESRTVRAVRAVDTATHPGYRGMGIFSGLTREALRLVPGDTDLVFNTPNQQSLPGYLKMGWRVVGRVPVAVRILRPTRFALGVRSIRRTPKPLRPRPSVDAVPAAQLLEDSQGVEDLLGDARASPLLATRQGVAFLRWRYAEAPLLDYRAVSEEREGSLRGLAIFRVRPRGVLWESTVAEVLFPAGDRATLRRLLRRVVKAAPVDHVIARAGSAPTSIMSTVRLGLFSSPFGPTLVVNALRTGLVPDPSDLGSWALSVGDLEVF